MLDQLVAQTEQWSKDKGLDLGEPSRQMLKTLEELGETATSLARGDEAGFRDGVGDTIVTLIILAQQKGYTIEECLEVAYNEIKGRKGKLIDGIFIKEEDFESN